MQTNYSKCNLNPDKILLCESQLAALIQLLVRLYYPVKVTMHAELFNEISIFGIFELVVQFDFVLGRILQNLVLILDHEQIALLLALRLINPLHAEQLPIKFSLYQKYLRICSFPYFSQYVEVVQSNYFALAINFEFGIRCDNLKVEWELNQSFCVCHFLKSQLVFIIKQTIVFSQHYVKVKVSRVTRDYSIANHLLSNFAIFEKILQNFSTTDGGELGDIGDHIIFGYLLVSVEIRINE